MVKYNWHVCYGSHHTYPVPNPAVRCSSWRALPRSNPIYPYVPTSRFPYAHSATLIHSHKYSLNIMSINISRVSHITHQSRIHSSITPRRIPTRTTTRRRRPRNLPGLRCSRNSAGGRCPLSRMRRARRVPVLDRIRSMPHPIIVIMRRRRGRRRRRDGRNDRHRRVFRRMRPRHVMGWRVLPLWRGGDFRDQRRFCRLALRPLCCYGRCCD